MNTAAGIFLVKSPCDQRGWDQGHRAGLAAEEDHDKVLNLRVTPSLDPIRSSSPALDGKIWGKPQNAWRVLLSLLRVTRRAVASTPSCHRYQDRSSS